MNSIFIVDLCSCLHDIVYESTRLNLNVNRELYYELKQALNLNEKQYLFRKWRLKLSIKLLTQAHKRVNLESNTILRLRSKHLNQQINLISFIKSYGNYLLTNLNKFQRILSFMISSDYSILHCEQFQMHLTWNLNLNYKHYLYEILMDNYFHIIHNRDESIILQPIDSLSLSPSSSLENTNATNNDNLEIMKSINNHELFTKTVVVMPKLKENQNDDAECIKRWLMSKFFYFDSSNTYSYETNHLENLFVTKLHSNSYGIRFCIKVCSSNLNSTEFETKLCKRTLFGSNSMIYILMPIKSHQQTFNDYMIENQKMLIQILKLYNENITDLKRLITSCQFMFVSYLNSSEQTEQVIRFILGNNNNNNFIFCLLDGDVVKDNYILLHNYEIFLNKCYKQNSVSFNFESINQLNNVVSLANICELSIMKFFEFLNHSPSSKNIYLSLNSIIDEYNTRLEQLIKMLTLDEYKEMGWPVPEFIDSQFSHEYNTTLKYWNTIECFEQTIKKQFYSLLSLNKVDNDQDDAQESLDLIEAKFLAYLNNLLKSKVKKNTLPGKSECLKSIYQLESKIRNSFKKLTNLKLISSKTNINWSEMITAIVDYLITSGYLTFQNNKHYLDKFYFYCNLDKLKAYDWINNSTLTTPISSPQSVTSDHFIIKKYERKQQSESNNHLKRRFSDETSFDDTSISPEPSTTITPTTTTTTTTTITYKILYFNSTMA